MRIALYKGTSWQSRVIRFVTRSQYSHWAFVFDVEASEAAKRLAAENPIVRERLPHMEPGAVIEAWTSGVRNVESLSADHKPNTEVDVFGFIQAMCALEEEALILECVKHIGDPYDYKGCLRFVTRRPGTEDDAWFCSEFGVQMLEDMGRVLFWRTKSWEVPPDWGARTKELWMIGTQVTT